MQVKAAQREKYKAVRKSIAHRSLADLQITDRLFSSAVYRDAASVFCYVSAGTEVDTKDVLLDALTSGKKVAVPYCTEQPGVMEFYFITSLSELVPGKYGILAPDVRVCVPAVSDARTLLVGPGLAFDRCGYRLGYGQGYYDRYLKKFHGISIGLCYNECIADHLAHDIYDQRVDYLACQDFIRKAELHK